MKKLRVAFYSFTSCEGCQLTLLECEDRLLDVLGAVEIVRFREASSYEGGEFDADADIAFVEGSISTVHDESAARTVRSRSKKLVAFGACADIGGVNAIKNREGVETARERVYGPAAAWIHSSAARPLSAVVPVDAALHGCPVDKDELIRFIFAAAVGAKLPDPAAPVCFECKLRQTACVFQKGEVCLGPITRGGCKAICPAFGSGCDGCRGLAPDANLLLMRRLLKERGLDGSDLARRVDLFNAAALTEDQRRELIGHA
ncbi:NADH:ubiquinone oxidoreductase [bacterium]|nr:NADH:ubiquinone oxidoreductase [bacterium]